MAADGPDTQMQFGHKPYLGQHINASNYLQYNVAGEGLVLFAP